MTRNRTRRRRRAAAPPSPLLFEVVPPEAYAPRAPILVAGVVSAVGAAARYARAYGQAAVRRGGILVAFVTAAQAPAYEVLPAALLEAVAAVAAGDSSFVVRIGEPQL